MIKHVNVVRCLLPSIYELALIYVGSLYKDERLMKHKVGIFHPANLNIEVKEQCVVRAFYDF